MRKSILWGAVAAIGLLGATSGQALAKRVCYQLDEETVWRLDVGFHSRLTTFKEKREFGHPIQKAYSIHGKLNADGPVTSAVTGTVDVARGVGARMGLTQSVLSVGGQFLALDCTSEEASATPEAWTCLGLTITPDGTFGPDSLTLTRVAPLENELCSAFVLPSAD